MIKNKSKEELALEEDFNQNVNAVVAATGKKFENVLNEAGDGFYAGYVNSVRKWMHRRS